jgi:CRP-like cAMP-binding protein
MIIVKEYLNLLKNAGLFKGVKSDEIETMLACLGSRIKKAKKGKIILLAGDKPEFVGIVLSGLLHIIREDYSGNRLLVTSLIRGEIFSEALCCAGISKSPVTVVAATDSVIMMLKFPRILNICPKPCPFHKKLLVNLLELMAKKNIFLQNKIGIISKKSVRARVMQYLESIMPKQGTEFKIPFNREEMADFLNVERSALSHELSRMKKDCLIEYKKNNFKLL